MYLRPQHKMSALTIGFSFALCGCTRIASYAPSLDVYGSYFPAWLICLIVGVVLTVLVSLIGRGLDLRSFRMFGPLIPISLILIFSITTWFLFFAS
jgi:YtcA family